MCCSLFHLFDSKWFKFGHYLSNIFPQCRWKKSINWIGIFKTLNIISFHIWARKSIDVRPAGFLQCQLSRMFSLKGKQRVQFVSDIHIDSAATYNQIGCYLGNICHRCNPVWSSCKSVTNLNMTLGGVCRNVIRWHMLSLFISWSSDNWYTYICSPDNTMIVRIQSV